MFAAALAAANIALPRRTRRLPRQNKTALITGASRRIGRATALTLARQGARILVHFGRSAHEAESLVAEIRTLGGEAEAFATDLSTPDGPTSWTEGICFLPELFG